MAQPSSAVPTTTSIATGTIAFVAVRVTFGFSGVESESGFITPVMLATASTPLSARITPTNATQKCPRSSCRGSRCAVVRCGALKPIMMNTTRTAGMASQSETLPLCFGPKKLRTPTMRMSAMVATCAYWLGMPK